MRSILALALTLVFFAGCMPQASTPGTTFPESTTLPAQTGPEEATSAPATVPPATEPDVYDPSPVEKRLASMSVEEKVGQLFLARCPDTDALADIRRYHLGGYILFARDFENHSPATIRALLAAYQQSSSIPMLLAVDEEGGDVTRVSRYSAFRSSKFLSPRKLYEQGGLTLVLETEKEKCDLLASLGINVNVGPVCDVTTDPDSFMYRRSLGQSPEITAEFAARTTVLMQNNGIGAVLKHFPGYGNNADTHTAMAVDTRPLSSLQACDLIPFQAGIDAGNCAILVSHTIVQCIDPSVPASLSPAVHAYLRETMGFNGVIITDDLIMGAITNEYGDEESAVMAVLAGNDLLCSSNYAVQYAAVLDAVNTGRISMEILDAAVRRILLWKQQIGLLPA